MFLEDKNKLKCCIPHRDFHVSETDDVTALEQSLEKSATTVVLWSHSSLASNQHKAEYSLSRYIELYRKFDFKIINVFLEDLGDITEERIKTITSSGEYMQWNGDATSSEKLKFFERLLAKLYRRMARIPLHMAEEESQDETSV